MTEYTVVKKIKRGTVYIELNRSEKCDGCKICSFNNRKTIVVPTVCDIKVDVGNTVEVEMPTRSVGGASLLIFALPLLSMLVGALIGLVGEWWLQLSLCGAGLVVGLVLAYVLDRVYRKKIGVLPKVIRKVDISNNAEKNEIDSQSSDGTTPSTGGDA